ncbi:MAG: hypothetical protein AB9866_17880 [Syntrophobacteraceae bacterium]
MTMTLLGNLKAASPLAILFNVFSLMFAAFMGLDFLEVKFDVLGLSSLSLAGISLALALLTFLAHKFYRPGRH